MRTISVFLSLLLLLSYIRPIFAQNIMSGNESLSPINQDVDRLEEVLPESDAAVDNSPVAEITDALEEDNEITSNATPKTSPMDPVPTEVPTIIPDTVDSPMLKQEPSSSISSVPTQVTPSPTILDTKHLETEKQPLSDLVHHSSVIISEVLLETSASSHEEYVELFNNTDDDIDLKNYRLTKHTSSGAESNLVSGQSFSGTIHSHDFFVIANQEFTTALHANLSFSGKTFTISKDSTITLYDQTGTIIDRVGFGKAKYFENSATENPEKNHSILRLKNDRVFTDTDNNLHDYMSYSCPQPGSFLPTNIYDNIRISEIYPRPCSSSDVTCIHADEYIEIYNPNDHAIDLAKWKLHDSSATGIYIFPTTSILPNQFFTLTKDAYGFALNDIGRETVNLTAPNCTTVSSVVYDTTHEGLSLNFASSWYWATPSPGNENAPDPRTQTYPQLLLTEILPNPTGEENHGEYIELYNPLDMQINLKNWTLRDASATGRYVFSGDLFIAPHSYHAIYRDVFTFALNNGKETVSLVAPNSQTMSYISYITSRENISYSYDIVDKKWRWTKHRTPGAKNIFNDLPQISRIKISSNAYKNVYANFTVSAKDPNNEKLTVRWDFGDGHRSYLWDTRHKYISNGIYHGSLRIQDESEEIMHYFTITVQKYPKYDLKINKIAPNPSGKDTGVEYLMIHNRSKKDIDLNGWSIATGSTKKNLVNHPVNRKFTIKGDTRKMMTHEYAAITLPNKTGVVELRRPDGTVSDHISYGDASRSIENDATFVLVNDKWIWIIPEDTAKTQRTLKIIMNAISNEEALRQQKTEREIAYNKVHAPKKTDVAMILTHKRSVFLIHLLERTNIFLAKKIPYLQKELIVFLQEHAKKKETPVVYKIVTAKDRCAITPIVALHNSKYDFCAEKK